MTTTSADDVESFEQEWKRHLETDEDDERARVSAAVSAIRCGCGGDMMHVTPHGWGCTTCSVTVLIRVV